MQPDTTPDLDELRDELRRTRNNLGELEEVSAQWMQAARSERARAEKAEADLSESKRRAEKAEARAKAGELLASQVLDLMEWLDALADRCDEDLENEARASIGSLALTAASAKAEEIIAGPEQGEVLSEKYAEELVRRTRALAQKEPKP